MSPQSAEGLLFRHLGKIIVAGVLVLLGLYLLNLAVRTTEAAQLKIKTEKVLSEIERARQNRDMPPEAEVDFYTQIKGLYQAEPQPGREPAWFAYKRPYVLRRATFKMPPVPLHFTPVLSVKADVGLAVLAWQDSTANKNVEIQGYALYRMEAGGRWVKIKKLDAESKEHVDLNLEHDREYSYKLVSTARPIHGAAPFTSSEDATKETKPQKIRSPFNFDLKIQSWGQGQIGGVIIIKKSDNKTSQEKFSWSKGSKVMLGGVDTGWVVEKIEENSVTIIKDGIPKTFKK